jgi:hypothetical protein
LAEILKDIIERSTRMPLGGFYVTKMKRDPMTGHYVGVATWIPKNQPLPGIRIGPEISVPSIPEHVSERSPQPPSAEESRTEPVQSSLKRAETKPNKTTMFDPYDAYEL